VVVRETDNRDLFERLLDYRDRACYLLRVGNR
jgi:hypothetical protein